MATLTKTAKIGIRPLITDKKNKNKKVHVPKKHEPAKTADIAKKFKTNYSFA